MTRKSFNTVSNSLNTILRLGDVGGDRLVLVFFLLQVDIEELVGLVSLHDVILLLAYHSVSEFNVPALRSLLEAGEVGLLKV